MDIWIPVFVAIVTSLFSYFAAVSKGKSELSKLEAQHRYDLDMMKANIEGQAKLYEETKQTDLTGNFMENMMEDPEIKTLVMKEALKVMKK